MGTISHSRVEIGVCLVLCENCQVAGCIQVVFALIRVVSKGREHEMTSLQDLEPFLQRRKTVTP